MAISLWGDITCTTQLVAIRNFGEWVYYYKKTQRSKYDGCYTDQGPMGLGQYNGRGVYCGLITASEVFLYFYYPTIQIFYCFIFIALSTNRSFFL